MAGSHRFCLPSLDPGTVPPAVLDSQAGFRKAACIMNTPDHDALVRAIEDARRILQEHIELSLEATRTVDQLLAILDRADVLFALGRVKRHRVTPLLDARKARSASLPHLPAPTLATTLDGHTSSEHPEPLG
jgi:hypothetical protein